MSVSHRSFVSFTHPPRNASLFGLESGMAVADFGSGSGAYALLMAERLEGTGHVYAVDIQRDLLRRTANEAKRRGLDNVEVICADLEAPQSTKLASGILDVVLASNILFQVEEKEAVLLEARRILKPKGRLIIIDWEHPAHPVKEGHARVGPLKESHVGKEEALVLARKVGFELVKEFQAGGQHYGLILRSSNSRAEK